MKRFDQLDINENIDRMGETCVFSATVITCYTDRLKCGSYKVDARGVIFDDVFPFYNCEEPFLPSDIGELLEIEYPMGDIGGQRLTIETDDEVLVIKFNTAEPFDPEELHYRILSLVEDKPSYCGFDFFLRPSFNSSPAIRGGQTFSIHTKKIDGTDLDFTATAVKGYQNNTADIEKYYHTGKFELSEWDRTSNIELRFYRTRDLGLADLTGTPSSIDGFDIIDAGLLPFFPENTVENTVVTDPNAKRKILAQSLFFSSSTVAKKATSTGYVLAATHLDYIRGMSIALTPTLEDEEETSFTLEHALSREYSRNKLFKNDYVIDAEHLKMIMTPEQFASIISVEDIIYDNDAEKYLKYPLILALDFDFNLQSLVVTKDFPAHLFPYEHERPAQSMMSQSIPSTQIKQFTPELSMGFLESIRTDVISDANISGAYSVEDGTRWSKAEVYVSLLSGRVLYPYARDAYRYCGGYTDSSDQYPCWNQPDIPWIEGNARVSISGITPVNLSYLELPDAFLFPVVLPEAVGLINMTETTFTYEEPTDYPAPAYFGRLNATCDNETAVYTATTEAHSTTYTYTYKLYPPTLL